jgi:5S rRNA maturation endonuclease (ribonuclease M5)
MINPKWLESTFIVRNIALDYENEDEYTSSMTDIKIERYRTFVAKHPTSTTYYQPILDVLEYRPSNLEYIPNVILVEGKNDYYTLSYFKEIILSLSNTSGLCPGNGSGSLDNIIRLYYAWGRNFVILLDADTEGVTQRKRYNELFGKIVEDKIYCLSDINKEWSKKGIEKV